MFISENSSIFISKINNRKNRLNTMIDNKYSNTPIFDILKRELSNLYNIKKIWKGLYLTNLSVRKYK